MPNRKVPTDKERKDWHAAFNAQTKIEFKRLQVYKPESQGQNQADNMLEVIRTQFMDAMNDTEWDAYIQDPKSAAEKCALWYTENELRRRQEQAASGVDPEQSFGLVPVQIIVAYSNGKTKVPISLEITCDWDEIAYRSIAATRSLDSQFAKYSYTRVHEPKLGGAAAAVAPQQNSKEPYTRREKVTKVNRNVDNGKEKWRVLTAVFQPYGVPLYDDPGLIPDIWKQAIKPGDSKPTDNWEVDILFTWKEKDNRFTPDRVTAIYPINAS